MTDNTENKVWSSIQFGPNGAVIPIKDKAAHAKLAELEEKLSSVGGGESRFN